MDGKEVSLWLSEWAAPREGISRLHFLFPQECSLSSGDSKYNADGSDGGHSETGEPEKLISSQPWGQLSDLVWMLLLLGFLKK